MEVSNGADLVQSVDVFLFDCDGVLFQGNSVIAGVPETLTKLRKVGKRLFFVTNNATKSRADVAHKLVSLGIHADAGEVICSAYSAARYFQKQEFRGRLYVVGESGLMDELQAHGIDAVGGPHHKTMAAGDASKIQIDPHVKGVIVGLDRDINYYKMSFAILHAQIPTNVFIATNRDPTYPAEDGRRLPGAGSLVSSIETGSGRRADILGKPSRWFVDLVKDAVNAAPERVIMIGDRLDTDVAFGIEAGFRTMLVTETGVHGIEQLKAAPEASRPTYHAKSVAALAE